MALWLNIPEESLYPTTAEKYFISSGGQTRSVITGGMTLLAKTTGLWIDFRLRPDGKLWSITEITAEPNSWFHLAITWNKYGELTVYINGIERYRVSGVAYGPTSSTTSSVMHVERYRVSGVAYGPTSSTTSSVMHVGKNSVGLTSFSNFSLDEWFFWSKTLSSEMVTLIYNLY